MKDHDLGAEENTRKVDIDDGLPVIVLHAENQRVAGDTGVVDDPVEVSA